MNSDELVALVDRLRALPAETEWLEFKRNRHEPQAIGEYLSASPTPRVWRISRGATSCSASTTTRTRGRTKFDPYAARARGTRICCHGSPPACDRTLVSKCT